MTWAIVAGAVCTVLIGFGVFLFLSRKDLKEKIEKDIEAQASRGGLDAAIKTHDAIEEINREMDGLRDFYGDDSDGLPLPAPGDGPASTKD